MDNMLQILPQYWLENGGFKKKLNPVQGMGFNPYSLLGADTEDELDGFGNGLAPGTLLFPASSLHDTLLKNIQV